MRFQQRQLLRKQVDPVLAAVNIERIVDRMDCKESCMVIEPARRSERVLTGGTSVSTEQAC